jgi:predicted nucleotidyltransferase
MDKNSALEVIDQFHRVIETRGIKLQKIILYGSYANGTNSEESDIDLVIISDDFSNKGYWERIDILSEAIYEVFAPIEAVAMTVEEWERGDSFIADFATNGEVLYAA